MRTSAKFFLGSLRIAMGSLFFYAGISKVVDPEWTAAGFLNSIDFMSGFFSWFALPSNIDWVNFANQWGLTAIGVSLILGLFVRYSGFFGILLMTLYYIPELSAFPYVGEHSYIVDEHVIYILVLATLMATCAGNYFGIDKYLPTCKKQPEEYGDDVTKVNY